MGSISKLDDYALNQIAQWIDGFHIIRLFLAGCRALNKKLSQLKEFSSLNLLRLSQPTTSIALFSNLQVLKLHLRE